MSTDGKKAASVYKMLDDAGVLTAEKERRKKQYYSAGETTQNANIILHNNQRYRIYWSAKQAVLEV